MAYLDPNMTGSLDQAKTYLNQQSQQRRQRDFTDQEFGQLAGQVGYGGTGNVTGTQVNQALDVMGWGDSSGTGVPSPTTGASPSTTQPTTSNSPIAMPTPGLEQEIAAQDARNANDPAYQAKLATLQQQGTNLAGLQSTPTQTVDPNTALAQVQQKFTTKFSRAMSPEEQQQAIAYAKQLGWDGVGPVPQNVLDQVLAQVDQYQPGGTQQPGPGAPAPGAPGPATPGMVDPQQALTTVQNAFQAKFNRQMSPQEQQLAIDVAKRAGWSGTGPVPQAAIDAVMTELGKYSGDPNNPYGAAPVTPPATQGGVDQAVLNRLNELLGLKWGEVDENSPAMRQQRAAFERSSQRARDKTRAALAERAAARGAIGTGGFDVDTERLLQQEGEANQAFGANLMAQELGTQRDALQNAIKMAIDLGQSEKARELQDKLGTLDLKLREYLGRGQLGLGLLNSQNQNNQFYDNLSLQLAQLQNLMNTQAIQNLFG